MPPERLLFYEGGRNKCNKQPRVHEPALPTPARLLPFLAALRCSPCHDGIGYLTYPGAMDGRARRRRRLGEACRGADGNSAATWARDGASDVCLEFGTTSRRRRRRRRAADAADAEDAEDGCDSAAAARAVLSTSMDGPEGARLDSCSPSGHDSAWVVCNLAHGATVVAGMWDAIMGCDDAVLCPYLEELVRPPAPVCPSGRPPWRAPP